MHKGKNKKLFVLHGRLIISQARQDNLTVLRFDMVLVSWAATPKSPVEMIIAVRAQVRKTIKKLRIFIKKNEKIYNVKAQRYGGTISTQ